MDLTYCANGCTTKHGDTYDRVTTEAPSQLCTRCETHLTKWLETIPRHYAELPGFLKHGSTDANPESKATKRDTIAAPIRLEILDLMDTRLGRKWLGTEATEDRRGALGTLLAIAREIIDGRQLTIPPRTTVGDLASFIKRHLEWVTTQDWITDTYTEIQALHRSLSNAVGEYRQKPVGRCPVGPDDDLCNGPLFPAPIGVRCPKCDTTWGAEDLRRLGLMIHLENTA